jgi:MFS family permease
LFWFWRIDWVGPRPKDYWSFLRSPSNTSHQQYLSGDVLVFHSVCADVVLASNWKSFCWYCGWNRQVAFLYSKRRRHYLFGCSLLSSRRDGIAATVVVPIYFSEISPIEVRGAVGTMHQVGITFGILVSQALSTPSLHLLGSDELWKWLFLVPVICGVVELAVLPFCPESPSYLYVTKGEKEARDALIRLQSRDVV